MPLTSMHAVTVFYSPDVARETQLICILLLECMALKQLGLCSHVLPLIFTKPIRKGCKATLVLYALDGKGQFYSFLDHEVGPHDGLKKVLVVHFGGSWELLDRQ